MSRPITTPPAPVVADSRKARIEALLAQQGVVPNWDAPAVSEIRTAGPQTGRLVGADVNPEMEYVRVSASQATTIARYMDRGYVLVSPDKDVRLDNCQGPNDVMMAAPRALTEQARLLRQQRRKGRREAGRDTSGGVPGYKTTTEGRWKPPAA